MPERPWSVAMNWHDLLFAHWPVPVGWLRPLIPSGLEIDTFDSSAWIGVVPFHMSGVRPKIFPQFLASQFPELNVRTYVKLNGKPGIWFFSLDATHWPSIQFARRFYFLPYQRAEMSVAKNESTVSYQSRRLISGGPTADFVAEYRPTGAVFQSTPGSIEHWLTERYCLFSAHRRGRIFCSDIHHRPWPLQSAEAEIQLNTMTEPLGFKVPDTKPLLHFAGNLEVVAWSLQ